ncbi:MAG TPA: hypothetical protein H9741_04955 [Candidatus Borkfalkia faecipullorum]|uniref:Uncharacterized protein n=1 Tax=Candidatus Borkfalkia faecipullorum TaxID=2838510 RepID=A0A9D2AG94_9FIRM|nr:hypothetical protein [Candidatus Borkfalkia faecipullorum]
MSEKKKIPIIRYLSYLLVVSLLFTGVTFSRYSMTTSGDSSAPLSRFHCSYEVDEISATSIPNVDYWLKNNSAASTARTLRYTVSNFKDDVTSDVAVKAHLRVYLPAEMARHLALQIGTMNIAEGTVTSYTPEIVLDELIAKREADTANAETVIDTSSFKNYYDSGVHNAADEELSVSGSLESASPRTISAVNRGGSGLSFTITASTKEAQYSLGFQRGKNENDYAPQLFLDLVRETEFYTIDLYLPSMEFPAGQPLTKMYIVYLTLTEHLEGLDFDAYWSGADAVLATTDADGNVRVENNSVLINSPPAAGKEYYYNGARVLGYHFDQTTQFAAQATAEGESPKSTTVRIQCLYDDEGGGYDIKLFHVAPITEDSTENYVHPIESDGESAIVFDKTSNTFSGNFSTGTCDQNQKIDLTNIVAHPFTEGLNAYQVLSKSYEVNFKALFVQASESEV